MVGGVGIEPTHLHLIRPAPSPLGHPPLWVSGNVVACYDRLGDTGYQEL